MSLDIFTLNRVIAMRCFPASVQASMLTLKRRISDRKHTVIGFEVAQRTFVSRIGLVAEDNLPTTILEQCVQYLMDVLAMCADMNAAHFPFQKLHERRKDQNLRLL